MGTCRPDKLSGMTDFVHSAWVSKDPYIAHQRQCYSGFHSNIEQLIVLVAIIPMPDWLHMPVCHQLTSNIFLRVFPKGLPVHFLTSLFIFITSSIKTK